jgi:Ankyrin repeats (3 copies)/Ankyrin repeats (many copies)
VRFNNCLIMSAYATALFEAIGKGRPLDAVQQIVRDSPDLVWERGRRGLLPLHYSIKRASPLDVVRFLVNLDDHALRDDGYEGKLPLHYAAHYKAPVELIEFLADRWDGALLAPDDNGWLPLHFAVRHAWVRSDAEALSTQLRAVRRLLERCPAAVRVQTTAGQHPLHLAVTSGGPLELIELLVGTWGHALYERDWKGCLPLHSAAKCSATPEVVQYLVDQCPRALQERDIYLRTASVTLGGPRRAGGSCPNHRRRVGAGATGRRLRWLSSVASCRPRRQGAGRGDPVPRRHGSAGPTGQGCGRGLSVALGGRSQACDDCPDPGGRVGTGAAGSG